MNFCRQFWTDSFRIRDLFYARFSKAIDGSEPAQQQILPVLAYSGAVVQNAFPDALLHQQLVVGVGEAVCLISNSLEQTQSARLRRENQR